VLVLADGALVADGPPAEVLASEALAEHPAGQTRYTQAARRVRESGGWPEGQPLPVTLTQAVDTFKAARH
jgi:energy-coupling factor transport system ATP-binding protein